ncbi:Autotransporter adhesin [Labilithrix luteola]|uniref:Autotransporter adhesin n=1 Tax=Labilithrix luteola TaxID=1391654 RepID=A0A0K1Q688_9BACT|nr:DUF2957 domain-containing protein [Labilithrix luteola]AKV01238.1 Autotransporter adhesin [Labilithrix luteola]
MDAKSLHRPLLGTHLLLGVLLAAGASTGACGSDDGGSTPSAQACSGEACLPETSVPDDAGVDAASTTDAAHDAEADVDAATPPPLCPTALDYTTTYTGGSISGEYVKIRFDTAESTYRLQFVESWIPTTAGTMEPTRAGKTIHGTFTHPTTLPSSEQNRCTFVLQDGQTDDGTYTVTIDPKTPPTIFVGNDVVTGAIPGATISSPGISANPSIVVGVIPARTFASFLFLAFRELETDFTKIAGRYNELGLHLTPTGSANQTALPQGWEPDAINWTETLSADGSCQREGIDYSCHTTGTPWAQRLNSDTTPDDVFVSRIVSASSPYAYTGQVSAIVLLAPSQARGVMIAGKVGGQIVPVVVRVGYSHLDAMNLMATIIDDQIGLSILSPVKLVSAQALDGRYTSVTSGSVCTQVDINGVSAAPAGTNGLNASIPHPELPGQFSGGFFHAAAGTCAQSPSLASRSRIEYPSVRFASGTTATFVDPTGAPVTATLTIDATQSTPGKLLVTTQAGLTARTTDGDAGDAGVPVFKAGDVGVLVTAGEVYALLMNNAQYNPFFTIGRFAEP